ncbi:hypothetical protein [Chryseolinea lacunae]|uniref:Uncharacterized protein n=1 Tax=Chryseolinea lacunae TaxID=2801331 RepID=A0ABS1KNY0_9BACT|nr:hypothetical protein [Chryseolinea lacunae]MBL0741038.1 hypothetical protein [Chryseolinea lacunae]
MIAPLAITGHYILQPGLLEKHKKTLEWLSASVLWKRELAFFQKLLDQYAPDFSSLADKQQLDHFQNLLLYYRTEVVDTLADTLRQHEKQLAEILSTQDETKTGYFKEHDLVMAQMESFNTQFQEYKSTLFTFIETAM